MIVEALADVLFALVEFVIGLIPTTNAPGWMSDGSDYLSTVWGYGAGLGAWVPWSLVGTVFSAVITCIGLGLAIKLTRIVASFFTAGGGSAA